MKNNDILMNFDWVWLKEFDFERHTLSVCLIGISLSAPWSLPALFSAFALCYKARLDYKAKVLEIEYKLQKNTQALADKAGKHLK